MNDDYRNTKYCIPLEKVDEKKSNLKVVILNKYPTCKNFYRKINIKGTNYNRLFLKIYNEKCVYCGSSNDILNYSTEYEIDHLINKSSFNNENEAGDINNLVCSCYYCNRGKQAYKLDDSLLQNVLNPDNGHIKKVFLRDDLYNIYISSKYKNDTNIVEFYKKLRLGNEFRRIDFLTMNIIGLIKTVDDEGLKARLYIVLSILRSKSYKSYKMDRAVQPNL